MAEPVQSEPVMTQPPTAERFRALARSSPWRWSSVEFEWRIGDSLRHAWIRRPRTLRVEDGTGRLLHSEPSARPRSSPLLMTAEDWRPDARVWPAGPEPIFAADGLVAERPEAGPRGTDFDAPFFENYHWTAMLDPAELAVTDWVAADVDARFGPVDTDVPVQLTDLRVVDHHGRPAWEARALPTALYGPRCNCCALLTGEATDDNPPWVPHAASVVRLDAGTGICVRIEHLHSPSIVDLDVRILAVDAAYSDEFLIPPLG